LLRRHGLEPAAYAETFWRTGQVFGGAILLHQAFASASGDDMWGASFTYSSAEAAKSTLLVMETPASDGTDPDAVWRWLVNLAVDLNDALEADLGVVNGFAIKRKEGVGGVPSGPEIAPGQPCGLLCPLMYWGSQRLREDQPVEALRSLPVARSAPTPGGGWVMQVTEAYSATTPTSLLRAYEGAFKLKKGPVWVATP
jgi:hypothetical protein